MLTRRLQWAEVWSLSNMAFVRLKCRGSTVQSRVQREREREREKERDLSFIAVMAQLFCAVQL